MLPAEMLESVRGYTNSLGIVAALILSSTLGATLDPVVDADRPALAFACAADADRREA